jgi:hypothetical protein
VREQEEIPDYEAYLMRLLGMSSKKELDDFLILPSWGCLDMQVPPIPEEEEDLEEGL